MMVLSVSSVLSYFCDLEFPGVFIGAQSGLSTVHLLLWEWICDFNDCVFLTNLLVIIEFYNRIS